MHCLKASKLICESCCNVYKPIWQKLVYVIILWWCFFVNYFNIRKLNHILNSIWLNCQNRLVPSVVMWGYLCSKSWSDCDKLAHKKCHVSPWGAGEREMALMTHVKLLSVVPLRQSLWNTSPFLVPQCPLHNTVFYSGLIVLNGRIWSGSILPGISNTVSGLHYSPITEPIGLSVSDLSLSHGFCDDSWSACKLLS